MNAAIIKASVHRFGDHVSLYVGNGQTVYLKPKDARLLAAALLDCENDVVDFPNFSSSHFTGVSFEFQGKE